MKTLKVLMTAVVIGLHFGAVAQTTQSSTVTVDRADEVMFKLEDMKGNYTGYWTMNDGKGNMAIKLGIEGDGNYVLTNDGAAEVLWGAHSQDGFMSLNAAKKGTAATSVTYDISLIVDSGDEAIKVSKPNNSKGGVGTDGRIIANASGHLITNKLLSRSTDVGLDSDLGGAEGDISLYDAAGTEFILGDGLSGSTSGIILRTATNPSVGQALFVVESEGFSERLRVDHDGALSTTNHLHVLNDANRTNIIEGNLRADDAISIGTSTFLPDYKLNVNGAIRSKEVVCESAPWPDYVFEEDYDLKSLDEVESFIREEGHLPNMPSAKEVEANGVALAKMNALLLEKIEELTLHAIDQNNRIASQDQKLNEQQNIIESLMNRVQQLEK